MSLTLQQIAEYIDAELIGDASYVIDKVATLQNAQENALSFLANSRYRKHLETAQAGAVIVAKSDADAVQGNALVAADPYVAYAKAASLLLSTNSNTITGIHPSAVVEVGALVHPTASVAAQCYIAANVVIDEHVSVGPGCIIQSRVEIGAHSRLVANVSLGEDVRLGERVIIHPGVVIGADGFGIANDKGTWIKVPQVGGVQIGNDVEIGANTTIDRGAIDDTIIGNGVKIDNQIQIGHNVVIGEHTVIAGCVGISGSTHIGHHCAIGGGTGIAGHLEITDNVMLTGMSMVTKSITSPGVYSSGIPVEPTRDWQKNVIRYRQLEKLQERVKQLETELKNLAADD